MRRFPYVRWTIIALFVGAMVINYLTRSVLGVAAPAIMAEQHISSAQYSWITGAFQFGIMFQPVAGYLLDLIGLKIGFTLFVAVWSLITHRARAGHRLGRLRGAARRTGAGRGIGAASGDEAGRGMVSRPRTRRRRRHLPDRGVVRRGFGAAAGRLGGLQL